MNDHGLNRTLRGFSVAIAFTVFSASTSADPEENPLAPATPQVPMTTESISGPISTGAADGHSIESVDGTGRGVLLNSDGQATIDSVDGTGQLMQAPQGTDSVDGTGRTRSIISTLAAPLTGTSLHNTNCDDGNNTDSNSEPQDASSAADEECTPSSDGSDLND